jgi:phosphoglycerate dehydrogenase-like enzyme
VSEGFRVGVTRDLLGPDGGTVHDVGLAALEADPDISWEFLSRREGELGPETVNGFDALLIWEPGGVSEATLAGADRLRLIARLGMGTESIDVPACTRHGVILTTSRFAVHEVMPAAAMSLLLALAHRIVEKDRAVREGRWDDRFELVGPGTSGRTIGIVGLGNIGRGVARMSAPFGLRRLAYDPHVDRAAVPDGVELIELDDLLPRADFVIVCAPLTPDTRHLISRERIALLRREACLVNVSRGPLVDTLALADALRGGRLAAAALDVFEQEPVEPDHPLLRLDNVLLSPHAIGYTRAAFRGLGHDACASVLAVAHGNVPDHVVNTDAIRDGRLPV